MDALHLTYDEVVYRIPYRNLVIMQKDKLRVCYGEKMEEVDDDYFFGKMKKRKKAPQGGQNSTLSASNAQGGTNIPNEKETRSTSGKIESNGNTGI